MLLEHHPWLCCSYACLDCTQTPYYTKFCGANEKKVKTKHKRMNTHIFLNMNVSVLNKLHIHDK